MGNSFQRGFILQAAGHDLLCAHGLPLSAPFEEAAVHCRTSLPYPSSGSVIQLQQLKNIFFPLLVYSGTYLVAYLDNVAI